MEMKMPRNGQRVSIVVRGETKLHDTGRVTSINGDKGIMVAVDSLDGKEVAFELLPDEKAWRWFLHTSHGAWVPGAALYPDKIIKYLIEGTN